MSEERAMIAVPLEDYERLLLAADGDDMLVTCDVCGAWLALDDPFTATTDDFTGCWKACTDGDRYANECRSYRAHALEEARQRAARSRA